MATTGNMAAIQQLRTDWISQLARCPRVSQRGHHIFAGDAASLPVDGCPCPDCELWNTSNRLSDELRALVNGTQSPRRPQ